MKVEMKPIDKAIYDLSSFTRLIPKKDNTKPIISNSFYMKFNMNKEINKYYLKLFLISYHLTELTIKDSIKNPSYKIISP